MCKIKTNKDLDQETVKEQILNGLVARRIILKEYLKETRGEKCEECGISEWMKQPITLILDHINGDAGNNFPINLRLLCPNCDALTSTFSGKNRGKGRKARGIIR